MGGISSRYTASSEQELHLDPNDKYQLNSNVFKYSDQEIVGDVVIPGKDINDVELNRIVNQQRQYYIESVKKMNDLLHILLQQIQLNILANNYNEKNRVILEKLLRELNEKKLDLKNSKEANLVDYRRMELIQAELKQKRRTIFFVIIAIIVLIVLLVLSFLLLKNNMKLPLPKLPTKFTIPFRPPQK